MGVRTSAPLSIIQGAPRWYCHIKIALIVGCRKQMKSPFRNDGLVFDELIDKARPLRDSKSIFALLLLLERELGSEAKNSNSQAAPPEGNNLVNHPGDTVFKRLIE